MRQFISVKEASQILGVTGHTLRAFLRELKEKEPNTYSTHILTYTHKFNKSLVIYTLNEDFVKGLKKRFSTHLHTHLHTYKALSWWSPASLFLPVLACQSS